MINKLWKIHQSSYTDRKLATPPLHSQIPGIRINNESKLACCWSENIWTDSSFAFVIESTIRIFQDCPVAISEKTLETVVASKSSNNLRFSSVIEHIIVGGKTWPRDGGQKWRIRVLEDKFCYIFRHLYVCIRTILKKFTLELDSLGRRVSKIERFRLCASMST